MLVFVYFQTSNNHNKKLLLLVKAGTCDSKRVMMVQLTRTGTNNDVKRARKCG